MILSITMAHRTIDGFDLDFRVIPYIVGSLYGGLPVAAVLSLIYIGMRIGMLDGLWEHIGFIAYLIVFIPMMMLSISKFNRACRKEKQQIAVGLASFLFLLFCIVFIMHRLQLSPETWNLHSVISLAAAAVIYYFLIWSAIFIIESVKEKQQLHGQLQSMSANYRNEVQKLQQFIDVTPLGVIIVDRNGEITHLNDMAIRMLEDQVKGKRNRFDLIGRPFTELIAAGSDQITAKLLHNALQGLDTASEIEQAGNNKIYIKTGFSVRDIHNRDIIGAALIAHDITEVSLLRDEVGRIERLSLVGQMAASITHEIRNPMAVIRGFVQLLQERSQDHQREYFQIIMDELDRANGIINDFLSLAQNRIVKKEKSSLNDIINELMPLLWADANLRGQSIDVHLQPNVPKLELNGKEMKQLILNLARNGMEAMDEKGQLIIATKYKEGAVELRVADTGCGIPKEKLERLFEPFYTTKTRGTGLGLPLCLSIVERHHGKIDVVSEENIGTTFIVTFNS
ncbi:ATP-binding protein [Paenibacillus tarimensis]